MGIPPVVLDVHRDAYHDDALGTDQPTLSKSIIQVLINQSPAHARYAHPRLNPNYVREDDQKYDAGTVAHDLFLEGIDRVAIIPFDDWRTKAAKEARDDARAGGYIPLLAKQSDEIAAMVASIRTQCDDHPEGPFFTDGSAERTLVWEDDYGVICRARLDWILDDLTECHDLKTTRASASPDAWSRTALNIGADIQAAFYGRGMRAVLGCDPSFRFVVAETCEPYATSVFAVAPDTLVLAEKKIDYALRLWAKCLRDDVWPAYPRRVAHITTPPWMEAAWLERELAGVSG